MIYYLRCSIAFCCYLLASINSYSQLHKIYLHPKASINAKQSQFIDSLHFIPLEVKERVEIGAYNNISITEKYFLITDYQEKSMVVYSRDGSLKKKINFKKLGESFYPSYNDHTNQVIFMGTNKSYSLTSKDKLKITLDWNNSRNKKYFKKFIIDMNDTSFTIQKDIPTENDVLSSFPFYDDYTWQGQITTSPLYKDSLDYEFKIYRNSKMVKGFFPYNHVNEPRFLFSAETSTASKGDNPSIHFITRPYCDTIYKMVKDSLFPAYQLVLPIENSLPPSFFSRPFKNKTDRENFARNNGWMLHQVHNFFETPAAIFFWVRYLTNFEFYAYVKETKLTYKIRNIKPDSSQYNLQLLGDYNVLRKGGKFYKVVKAGDLISFFDQNKNVPVPAELQSFLKNSPHTSSPVIVEYTMKN
jgi:hypothetical protein